MSYASSLFKVFISFVNDYLGNLGNFYQDTFSNRGAYDTMTVFVADFSHSYIYMFISYVINCIFLF